MGQVFNIQKSCLDDGPGIRTTVFLKGCPLRCVWCHNPESQSPRGELSFFADRCRNCGACLPLCPNNCHSLRGGVHFLDRSACTDCGLCCRTRCGNLELFGREMPAAEVIARVLEDKPFYTPDGGMTLSGGEPLFQPDFCLELLRLAKENDLHTCMETCGFAPEPVILKAAAFTDLFLFDCKESDPARHKAFTGADPAPILSNLRALDRLGKRIILRCPVIPGSNARPDHFAGVGRLAASLKRVEGIELIPHHNTAAQKYRNLGREYPVTTRPPTRDEMEEWKRIVSAHTDAPVSFPRLPL